MGLKVATFITLVAILVNFCPTCLLKHMASTLISALVDLLDWAKPVRVGFFAGNQLVGWKTIQTSRLGNNISWDADVLEEMVSLFAMFVCLKEHNVFLTFQFCATLVLISLILFVGAILAIVFRAQVGVETDFRELLQRPETQAHE